MNIPNHDPNQIVEEIISKRRPNYIGFLEYLYMPSVSRTAVSDGVKGLIVVLWREKILNEDKAHASPIMTIKILNASWYSKVIGLSNKVER